MSSSSSKVKVKLEAATSSDAKDNGNPGRAGRSGSSVSIDQVDSKPDLAVTRIEQEANRLAQAKKRHEDDVKTHKTVDVRFAKPEDDWQVAYVWSFIVKFNLRGRIARLESMEDFERSLLEPVANRPDDVLENTIICFLSNLKPGTRNLSPENVQSQLSAYINDHLINSTEWTVWDRGWPMKEEDRGSCCTLDPHRDELGRLRYPGEPLAERAEKNPIRRIEQQGGGLFELDWRERIRILRQLVDWQLSHSENIRNMIHREFPSKGMDGRKKAGASGGVVHEKDSIITKEVGLNRDRARVWSFDDSWRLYKSGNPFKRPCPLVPITTTREGYETLLGDIEQYGARSTEPPNGGEETAAHRKTVVTINNEKALGERLRERIEGIEKEEVRIQRARRKIVQALEMQQLAELRSTRTRRQGRKVDYVYDDHSDVEDPDGQPSKRSRRTRGDGDFVGVGVDSGRPSIPGERRSARMSGRGVVVQDEPPAPAGTEGAKDKGVGSEAMSRVSSASSTGAGDAHMRSSVSVPVSASVSVSGDESRVRDEDGKRRKGMKGYA